MTLWEFYFYIRFYRDHIYDIIYIYIYISKLANWRRFLLYIRSKKIEMYTGIDGREIADKN